MEPELVQVYTRFLYPSPVANGLAWFHAGSEDPAPCVPDVLRTLELFGDPSINGAPETALNNKTVPEIAVNGVVDGVKLLV